MLRGTVHIELDHDVQRRYAAAVAVCLGRQPVVGEFTLFAVDIDDVTYIDDDINAQHVARQPARRWLNHE